MNPINPQYAGWAVGTMGASLLLNTFSVATLFFLVTVLKIDPLLAGSLIMVSKLYDAVSDPVMGYVSDRTRSPTCCLAVSSRASPSPPCLPLRSVMAPRHTRCWSGHC